MSNNQALDIQIGEPEANLWLKVLEELICLNLKLISKSNLVLKEFPIDWIHESISGYYDMNLSKKRGPLHFICGEALCTM